MAPMVRVIIEPQSPPWVTAIGVSRMFNSDRYGLSSTVFIVAQLLHQLVAGLGIALHTETGLLYARRKAEIW